MFVGIVLTNGLDFFKIELHKPSISLCSDVSLQLFLAMSLMSLQLWTLGSAFGPLVVILFVQISVMMCSRYTLFSRQWHVTTTQPSSRPVSRGSAWGRHRLVSLTCTP